MMVRANFMAPRSAGQQLKKSKVLVSHQTGTIEAGKEADLILIDGYFSKDVSNIRKMEIVFKDGIGFDSKKIFDSVKGRVGLH